MRTLWQLAQRTLPGSEAQRPQGGVLSRGGKQQTRIPTPLMQIQEEVKPIKGEESQKSDCSG